MKEILYIQAGNFPNYVGTHFWNVQNSYFEEEETEYSIHDFQVSWRESFNGSRSPRLLLFDEKTNFGSIGKIESEPDIEEMKNGLNAWDGKSTVHRQDIQHSVPDVSHNDQKYKGDSSSIRHWSDFNEADYTTRTIQKIPADLEHLTGDWSGGHELFTRYNEGKNLMETDVRLFLEECDSPQGLQIINDSASFGGFMDNFLTSIRDEITKLPALVMPILSESISQTFNVDDRLAFKKAVNDALSLRSLDELATITIPVQSPTSWPGSALPPWISPGSETLLDNSAILSALVESVTLPLRTTAEDLASLSSRLSWRGGHASFGELCGKFPFISAEKLSLANFSSLNTQDSASRRRQFRRLDVTRGLTVTELRAVEAYGKMDHSGARLFKVEADAFPLPISFPSRVTFDDRSVISRDPNRPGKIKLYSALSAGEGTSRLFLGIANTLERFKRLPTTVVGLEKDEFEELVYEMRSLCDTFTEEEFF